MQEGLLLRAKKISGETSAFLLNSSLRKGNEMAYDFIPERKEEILNNRNFSAEPEYASVFNFLTTTYPRVKKPIALSKKSAEKKNIKVTRALTGTVQLDRIKRNLNLKNVKLSMGEGSRGNRGTNNRGNLFEGLYAEDVRSFWRGEKISDVQTQKSIDYLRRAYKLDSLKDLKIMEEGAANTRRPLIFRGNTPIISSPTSGLDIGKAVTDLTIKSGQRDIAYLSLKLKNTVTFFNIGVKTILTRKEIENGIVENADGLKLLNMLGLDPEEFCKPFNGGYTGKREVGRADKIKLREFLRSGIGYGYCVVHKVSSGIKTYTVDLPYLNNATQIQGVNVFYGGKTGTGKRVDIEVKTPKYVIKMNIRDSQGTDGYPTRIMGDFSYV